LENQKRGGISLKGVTAILNMIGLAAEPLYNV
jgi:hypothetical protein